MRSTAVSAAVATALFTLAACGPEPEPAEPLETTTAEKQELVAVTTKYWPQSTRYEAPHWVTGPTFIEVCFMSGSPQLREQVKNRAERSWQRAGRITFRGWGDCTPTFSGIRIDFRTSPGQGSFSDFGTDALGKTTVTMMIDPFDTQNSTTRFEFVISHEFGHALSFAHSECRSDYAPAGDRNLNGIPDTGESFQGGNPCAAVPTCLGNRTYGSYDVRSVMSSCGRFSVNLPTFSIGLSPNDTAGLQTAYGRKIPGQLVTPRGKCLTMPNASQGILFDCDERDDAQELRYTMANETLDSRGRCLESSPSTTSPSAFLYPVCDGYSGQKWRFESAAIVGWGGLCLDLENGVTSGGRVQLFDCGAAGGVNQRWTVLPTGEIKFGASASASCLTAAANGGLVVSACTGAAAQKFDLLAGGQLRVRSTGACADVPGPFATDYSPSNGANGFGLPQSRLPVNTFACLSSQLNQRFHLSGPVRHLASSQCLERAADGQQNGTLAQKAACNGSEAQTWDYYPL